MSPWRLINFISLNNAVSPAKYTRLPKNSITTPAACPPGTPEPWKAGVKRMEPNGKLNFPPKCMACVQAPADAALPATSAVEMTRASLFFAIKSVSP